jgi:hypothetical protein
LALEIPARAPFRGHCALEIARNHSAGSLLRPLCARNHCSSTLIFSWGALKVGKHQLRGHWALENSLSRPLCARNRSKSLLELAFEASVRSKSLLEHAYLFFGGTESGKIPASWPLGTVRSKSQLERAYLFFGGTALLRLKHSNRLCSVLTYSSHLRRHCTASTCALYDSTGAVRRHMRISIYIYIYLMFCHVFPARNLK